MIECKSIGLEAHTDLGSNLRSFGYDTGGGASYLKSEGWYQGQPNGVTLLMK